MDETLGMIDGHVKGRRRLMAAPTRTPRERWIEEGMRALAAGGPDAVRVESLARTLGVTRGGFYWHFADREALLVEMLDAWERDTTSAPIDRLEAEGGDVRVKLRRLWQMTSRGSVFGIDLAVRDWARRDPAVARRLVRVDDRRMEYLRALYRPLCADEDDVESRALLSFSLLIGDHFIAAGHGGLSRAEVIERTLRWLGAAPADA
jgi:AcrR family transcriptional regulator